MKSVPPEWSKLQVVLAHDWLTGMRGGEKVLELLCEGFPEAPVYTLLHNPEAISDVINSHRIHTSRLQHVPGVFEYYRYFLPFFPRAIETLRPPEADLVISASHCVAKGLQAPPGTRHLCYCFTPMRYAWVFYEEYFGRNILKKALVRPLLKYLRSWDYQTSQRVTRFVAISQHVQDRIESCYGRPADVVYPPVDTEFYTPAETEREDFALIVSALVPYKRVDLAIKAFNRTGKALKIVGTGTENDHLQAMAKPNIEFLGWQSSAQIRELYRRCRCLVFPGEEDFGIVPVEAQACGAPVVAFAAGGVTESIEEDLTGTFFETQDPDALIAADEAADGREWDSRAIRANAERFSIQHFIDGFAQSVYLCLADQN